MLGVKESFRVLTVHNTTQSMTAHQELVLCCNTCFKEILYNDHYHHGHAPTALGEQITLRPCSSKTSLLHAGVQTYSSGFCHVLRYRAETGSETSSTSLLSLCSSTVTHKMPTTQIFHLKDMVSPEVKQLQM